MQKRKLFTLIELLVVVTVIAILASLLLPTLARAKFMATLTACKSNLRQVTLGITLYTDDYDEWYPEGGEGAWSQRFKEGRVWSYGGESDESKYNALADYFTFEYGNYKDISYRNPVWQCPQGKVEVPSDKTNTKGYYSTFYNLYHGQTQRVKEGGTGPWIYEKPENVMRKPGQRWRLKNIFSFTFLRPIYNLRYDVIAADIQRRDGNSGQYLMTNHIWGPEKLSSGDPLYWRSMYGDAYTNYLFSDGHAEMFFKPVPLVWLNANMSTTGGFADKDNYMMPHEYGSTD